MSTRIRFSIKKGFDYDGSWFLLAGNPSEDSSIEWWKASNPQIEACKKIRASIHGFQFLAGHVEKGNANGYAYKANQHGIWLRTSDGVYREVREIYPALRPPE